MKKEVTIYNFCPCYKDFEGELICLNNDSLCDIEHSIFAADILNQEATLDLVKQFEIPDGKTCYSSIYTYDGCVYCSSQGFKIRIHKEDITDDMLSQAIRLYALGPTQITVDCASCIYGILLALVLSQDQASIKRYLDEFSLKVAIKFTELELDDVDESTPYFETVQSYLVKLLEDQYYWQEVHKNLIKSKEPKPLIELVNKMELLDRLQFLFYSQVLNIRSIESSRILVRMLSHILRTSRNILDLNEEIHALVASDTIGGHEEDETLILKIEDYMEKSRTLDHFFGNIADIMKGTS
ncbi:MAG: hypothetical protein AM325_012520 [Candidatus Thorarchaeota archaeon SMTZ1-45]|nr:MAG: hypothetical protein AM325_14195 [Candidatus Thorarchaeota archaeon SMTZ1-45]